MDKIKLFFISLFSAIASGLGILAIPFFLLLSLNITDYITGLLAAKFRNEQVNSYKGIRGIIKKICMLLLVGLGAVLDWVIMFATNTVGLQIPFTFVVSTVVAVWLICNEIISILENMIDIGVDLPPFLQKVAKYIRKQAEEKIDLGEVNSHE